jgi:hypothetical protein
MPDVSHGRVFLEKLIVVQLVKKFPTFMELEGSLRVHKSPPLVPIPIQMNPVHPVIFCFF